MKLYIDDRAVWLLKKVLEQGLAEVLTHYRIRKLTLSIDDKEEIYNLIGQVKEHLGY